jgi:hypothetical protein
MPPSSKAFIAAPGESTAEFDFIARRFMEGTQALGASNEKKRPQNLPEYKKKPRFPENSRRSHEKDDLAELRTSFGSRQLRR